MSEQRDRKELLELANIYLPVRRCVGGHLVHADYVCPHCDSNNPCGSDGYCSKEGIKGAKALPEDLPTRRGGWKVKA